MENSAKELDASFNLSEHIGHLPREINMLKRAVAMLREPARTWPIVSAEAGGLKEVFIPYTIVIGLLPMLAGDALLSIVWGALLMVMGAPGVSLGATLIHSVLSYAEWMVGLLVLGKIVEAMAPALGLKKSGVLACRVLVYGSTPMFLGSVLGVIPVLGPLCQLGFAVWSVSRGPRRWEAWL